MDEKKTSRWGIAAACSGVVLLLAVGGLFAVRDQIISSSESALKAERGEREKLASRLSMLQTSIDALDASPQTDGVALEALQKSLAETNSKLDILTARVDALEQKPVVAAPAPSPIAAEPTKVEVVVQPVVKEAVGTAELVQLKLAVQSGKPFADALAAWVKMSPESEASLAPLAAYATEGMKTESALIRELGAVLDATSTAPVVEEAGTVGKINTHLKGLVSIKKSAAVDPYAPLRKDVLREDVETLERSISRMDEAARAPFADWLMEAKLRREALDALEKVTVKAGQ